MILYFPQKRKEKKYEGKKKCRQSNVCQKKKIKKGIRRKKNSVKISLSCTSSVWDRWWSSQVVCSLLSSQVSWVCLFCSCRRFPFPFLDPNPPPNPPFLAWKMHMLKALCLNPGVRLLIAFMQHLDWSLVRRQFCSVGCLSTWSLALVLLEACWKCS